jgi:hypothetical protein
MSEIDDSELQQGLDPENAQFNSPETHPFLPAWLEQNRKSGAVKTAGCSRTGKTDNNL